MGTEFVTPSTSELNMVSPTHPRHNQRSLTPNRNENVTMPLTENALSKMQLEQQSPQFYPPTTPPMESQSSPQRKRKRENDLEVPASPEKVAPPAKRRAVAKAGRGVEIPDSQDSRIPETPEKDRKRKASPTKLTEPVKKVKTKKTVKT